MKYIIELEDEPYMREDGVNYYTCKSARWYKLGEIIINRLTPYTEPDLNPLVDEAVETIENEVWELVRVITDMTEAQRKECFGGVTCNLDEYMTYQEAKAQYESWKKQKEEIKDGDEVENTSHKKGIVFNHYISPSNGLKYVRVLYMDDEGNSFISAWEKNDVVKTGRHFDEVAQMLQKMRGDKE